MSGAVERLRPLRGTGAGTVITGTVGAVSFRPLLLLDLDFDAAGWTGVSGVCVFCFDLMLLDFDFDVDAAAEDAAAGGPGGSGPLLLAGPRWFC